MKKFRKSLTWLRRKEDSKKKFFGKILYIHGFEWEVIEENTELQENIHYPSVFLIEHKKCRTISKVKYVFMCFIYRGPYKKRPL